MWNKLAIKVDAYQTGIAMLLMLGGMACLAISPLSALYFFLAAGASVLIHRFSLKGAAFGTVCIVIFSLIAYFSRHEVMTWWQAFWVVSLCTALYLVAEGQLSSKEEHNSLEAALKQETDNGVLWKARFETLKQQLQQEKDKLASLEQDMVLLEEKHEERIEALKELIELTSSESARHRHRLEHLLTERDGFEEKAQALVVEIENLKSTLQQSQKEPMFTDEESLKRLEALNEERFDNYQLRLLLSERRKEQKIQEKVKRERTPRAVATGQEKITLQDLAKVISKNIR